MAHAKFKATQPCRYYDITVDDVGRQRHSDLIMEFIHRGVLSPRGGSAGPLIRDYVAVEGKYRYIHFLDESVCDEYERRMKGK